MTFCQKAPSHDFPQKVRVGLFGQLGYEGKRLLKNTLNLLGSQDENCLLPLKKTSLFQAPIADLRLKCCILGDRSKNKSSGSTPHFSTGAIGLHARADPSPSLFSKRPNERVTSLASSFRPALYFAICHSDRLEILRLNFGV